MVALTAPSSSFIYAGIVSRVKFTVSCKNELTASVKLFGYDLTLTSASSKDYISYVSLFTDQSVMEHIGDHQARTAEEVQLLIDGTWKRRWKKRDPFSGLAGHTSDGRFVCHAMLMHTETAGEAELMCIVAKRFWGKGIGTAVCSALITDYAQAIIGAGYLLEGKPLTRIVAHIAPGHDVGDHIMKKIGMTHQDFVDKFKTSFKRYVLDFEQATAGSACCVIL
jgi:RimJ/RimL family protein N-acetyltransferase